jgi:hypothetical protein
LYIKSVNKTVDDYAALLKQQKNDRIDLTDLDFDTGRASLVGEYSLADTTYGRLLNDLAKTNFQQVSAELKQSVLDFYANPNAPAPNKRNRKSWEKTRAELEKLKAADAAASVPASGGDLP